MSKIKKTLKQMYKCRFLYLLILPSLITVFIFHYIPIYGVQIAFKDYRTSLGIAGSEWVGLKHFEYFILEYPYFWKVVLNTVRISLYTMATFIIPIIFAIMLNEMRNQRLKKTCQMITYAPHFVSTVVVCSMVLLFTSDTGLVNIIAGFFGKEATDYISEPSLFAGIYTISEIWQDLGWDTIIFLATLAGVSEQLVEAAKLDGAGRFKVIWYVQIPHLMPTIITLLILRTGKVLSVGFEKVFLLQNDLNLDASSVISTYVYEMGLVSHQYSYSAAIGLFNNIINVLMIILVNKISKKVADIGLW